MLLCPRCTKELAAVRGRAGITFVCATCRGQAAMMPVLRKAVAAGTVNDLWRRARGAERRGDRPCPSCHDGMAQVGVHDGTFEAVLDACDRCQMVWFDFDEMERLPERAEPKEERLSPRAREALAIATVRHETDPDDEPSVTRLVAVHLGVMFPQKAGGPTREGRPWVTWALATAILAWTGGLVAYELTRPGFDGTPRVLLRWAYEWGFVPADPWRHGGLTLVTSFLLHGSWWHALSNAYFLALAGEDVEEVLGRARYVLLLLVATAAGCGAMAILEPRSIVPCVGASGGIAGIFAYYALALPRVRIGLFFLRRGISLPVRWLFVGWFALEWCLAEYSSLTGVAHGAHVGGALAGLAWWAVEAGIRGARKVEAGSVR